MTSISSQDRDTHANEPEDPEDFRGYVRDILAGRLAPRDPDQPPSLFGIRDNADPLGRGRKYLETMADVGWATPRWPRELGGAGFTAAQATILSEELLRFEVPDLYPFDIGLRMVAAVLLKHGNDEQRARWLEDIRLGEQVWAQLFSEPEAGSDLAGLVTRARRENDGWRIKGHKIWSSRAPYASWGFLLARTDENVAKHAGITAFALDLSTPGVDIHELRQMNGDAHFAEVFLDDVFVPDDCRLGEVNEGWRVAMTTLSNERAGLRTTGLGLKSTRVLNSLLSQTSEPVLRAEVIDAFVELEVAQLTSARAAAKMARGAQPGPEGSGEKLRNGNAMRRLMDVALRVQGAGGLVDDDFWSALALTIPSMSIRGGTDEIQKNIIGERILGLPKEPSMGAGVAFHELRRRTPRR